jgi:hypothetical protein
MRNRRLLGFASIIGLIVAGAAAAAEEAESCALSAPERHRVTEVKDGETLALTDGTVVRLIGAIELPGHAALAAGRGGQGRALGAG